MLRGVDVLPMISRTDLVTFVNNFPALLSVGDLDGNLVAISPLLLNLLGYTFDEYSAQPFLDLIHPDDLPAILQDLAAMKSENATIDGQPLRWRKKDGSYIWLKWQAKTSQGFIFATAQNATKERELESENFESHSQFEKILKNAPGMIYQFKMDTDGTMHFPFASDKAFEIYEIQPEDFKADPSLMLKMAHPDDQAELQKLILASAQSLSQFEWAGRIITKSGKTRWIKARSIPRRFADGAILWDGLVIDTTHEVTLEEELEQQRVVSFHSARLASIGELAAGVGHEINNPLAIIMGKAERLRRKLTLANAMTEDFERDISVCLDACNRIRRIVDGLRTFSRKASPGSVGCINEAVTGTVALVRQIYIQDGIEIATEVPDNEIYVACDLAELQQVAMNLITNARDATKGREDRVITIKVEETPTVVLVRVKDNGSGIPLDVQPKIFDSFFTTKPVGQGTGIGLALSRSIVTSAGGEILFTTIEGKGTEFVVRLPKISNEEEKGRVAPVKQAGAFHGRVLLVDDESGVREVLTETLRELGFQVTCASSTDGAIELIGKSEFDLVFTDQRMPGKNGIELLTLLQKMQSPVRCKRILITGGSTDNLAANRSLQDGSLADAVMTKPFTDDQLRSTLQKIRYQGPLKK